MQIHDVVHGAENARRVEALDLLRMVAVIGVIAYHFGFNGPTSNGTHHIALPDIGEVAKYGYLGVQLFFVISGFAIAFTADGRSASDFVIARVSRIYPAFLFCMSVTFVLTVAFGAPEFQSNLHQWAANLIIAAPALKQPYVDSVYWTIMLELTFYAWVYLLMLSGLFQRHLCVTVLVWIALSMVNEAFIGSHVVRKLLLTDQSGFFASGLLLYELYAGRQRAAVQWTLAFAAICAVLSAVRNVAWFREHLGGDYNNWVVAAISLGAIIVTMLGMRIRRIPLPPYLIVAIGGLTYPLYLLHQQIGYLVFLRLKELVGHPAVLVGAIVSLMVTLSWATWKYVDRPGQRLARRGLQKLTRRPESKTRSPASDTADATVGALTLRPLQA
ncbi:MAG: acyltransferase [Pseudomonadota bacterium]